MVATKLLPIAVSHGSAVNRGGGEVVCYAAIAIPCPESFPGKNFHGWHAGQEGDDSWERWNQVRCLTWHNAKLGVVLDVPAVLPPKEEIVRWYGEPVKALLLPTSVFLINKRGFPTLSKAHQDMLLTFFNHGVQVGVGLQPCFGIYRLPSDHSVLMRVCIKAP
jgi:hypothetical protein